MSSLSESQNRYVEFSYWGILIATLCFGCTFMQSYFYFQKYRDGWPTKIFVSLIILANTVNWILLAKLFFFYLAENYDNPSALTLLPWEYSAGVLASAIVQALAQLFFARQIYLVNKKSWAVALIIVFFALCSLAFGIALTTLLSDYSSLEDADSKVFVIVGNVSIVVPIVCDFIATAAMWYFLDSIGVTKTRSTIKSIRLLVLNRGLLLITAQITYLVLWLIGETYWYWLPFHMNIPNIYTNTMLLLLNERASIRAKENAKEMLSLQLTSGGRQLQFNVFHSLHAIRSHGLISSLVEQPANVNDIQNIQV